MASNYFDRFDEKPAPAVAKKPPPAPENPPPPVEDANYFDMYSDPSGAADAARRRFGREHPILRRADAAARGAADFVSFGYMDELAGSLNALPQLMPGGESYEDSRDRHIAYERAYDEADKQEVPWSRGLGEAAGFGGTLGLSLLSAPTTIGRAGTAAGRVAKNFLKATGAGAAMGGLSASGNATGDIPERLEAAIPGAALGGVIGFASVPLGYVVGRGVNHLVNRGRPMVERAANQLAGRFSAARAAEEAQRLRDLGLDPSMVNVVDDATRGYVAAAARRQTPARDVVQGRADASRVGMPGRVREQARRISDDPRTAAELEAEAAQRISDAATPPESSPGYAGVVVSQALNGRRNQAKAAVDNAFREARAFGPDGAHLPIAERPAMAAQMRDAVTGFTLEDLPRVKRVMDDFDNLQTLTVKDMFDLRTRLVNLQRSNDPVEAKAAGALKFALDDVVDSAMDRGLITGANKDAVEAWQTAIAYRRSFGQKWENRDTVDKATARIYREGEETTKVAPEDLSNVILGRGSGLTVYPDMARNLATLRERLGEASPEWLAVQEEAVARILNKEAGKGTYGQAWREFERRNPELADVLMSPRQRAALDAAQAEIMAAQAQQRALGLGKEMATPNAPDASVAAAGALDDAEKELARIAMRRQVEQRAGETPAAAIATAENLAIAPEAQARTRALLPEDQAAELEAAMGAEVQAHRQIQQVAPRTGSPTSLNTGDDEVGKATLSAAETVLGGPKAWRDWVVTMLRSEGITSKDAEAVANIATDPAMLDDLLSRMDRLKPGSGSHLRALLNQAPARDAGEMTQGSQRRGPRPSVSVHREDTGQQVGASYGVWENGVYRARTFEEAVAEEEAKLRGR